MKKTRIIALLVVILLMCSATALALPAGCSNWWATGTSSPYCDGSTCNGNRKYQYQDVSYQRECVTDAGTYYTETMTVALTLGCC